MKVNHLPVVVIPIILFTDDSSGNKSKKWNKFDSWSFTVASLPKEDITKLDNINFICCSNQVSAIDMIPEIARQLKCLEKGFIAYDSYLKLEVLVVSPLLCIIADNPRHSELLNHLGGKALKYCRMCTVSSLPMYSMYIVLGE